jgi:hypothetical protein
VQKRKKKRVKVAHFKTSEFKVGFTIRAAVFDSSQAVSLACQPRSEGGSRGVKCPSPHLPKNFPTLEFFFESRSCPLQKLIKGHIFFKRITLHESHHVMLALFAKDKNGTE